MSAQSEEIRRQLAESARLKQSFPDSLIANIEAFAKRGAAAVRAGGKLVFFGNGGSAADAQHLAAELVVRLQKDRPGIAALALTTNSSILTAAGNDRGFDTLFSRQIETLVGAQDLLVAISTSGASPNVLAGVEAGRKQRAFVVGMTGETGGKLKGNVDLLLNVPSTNPQRIQEAHITIGHIVCALIEEAVGTR
jgi:D-sedoheptulose 7-phosphate isomerase